MIHEFSQSDIEKVKEEIESMYEFLVEKFIDDTFTSKTIEDFGNVPTDEAIEESEKQAKALIKEAIKQLKY